MNVQNALKLSLQAPKLHPEETIWHLMTHSEQGAGHLNHLCRSQGFIQHQKPTLLKILDLLELLLFVFKLQEIQSLLYFNSHNNMEKMASHTWIHHTCAQETHTLLILVVSSQSRQSIQFPFANPKTGHERKREGTYLLKVVQNPPFEMQCLPSVRQGLARAPGACQRLISRYLVFLEFAVMVKKNQVGSLLLQDRLVLQEGAIGALKLLRAELQLLLQGQQLLLQLLQLPQMTLLIGPEVYLGLPECQYLGLILVLQQTGCTAQGQRSQSTQSGLEAAEWAVTLWPFCICSKFVHTQLSALGCFHPQRKF